MTISITISIIRQLLRHQHRLYKQFCERKHESIQRNYENIIYPSESNYDLSNRSSRDKKSCLEFSSPYYSHTNLAMQNNSETGYRIEITTCRNQVKNQNSSYIDHERQFMPITAKANQ